MQSNESHPLNLGDRLINIGDIFSFTDKDNTTKNWLAINFEIDRGFSVSRTIGIQCNSCTSHYPDEMNVFSYHGYGYNYNKEYILPYDALIEPKPIGSLPMNDIIKYSNIVSMCEYYDDMHNLKEWDHKKIKVGMVIHDNHDEDSCFIVLRITMPTLNDPSELYGYTIKNTSLGVLVPSRLSSAGFSFKDAIEVIGYITPKWYYYLSQMMMHMNRMPFRANINDLLWYKFK